MHVKSVGYGDAFGSGDRLNTCFWSIVAMRILGV
jgi:hypothetical protein